MRSMESLCMIFLLNECGDEISKFEKYRSKEVSLFSYVFDICVCVLFAECKSSAI